MREVNTFDTDIDDGHKACALMPLLRLYSISQHQNSLDAALSSILLNLFGRSVTATCCLAPISGRI